MSKWVYVLGGSSLVLGAGCNDPTRPGEGRVKERWFKQQLDGLPYTAPLIDASSVFFASGGGLVIARDVDSGEPLWTTSVGQSPFTQQLDPGGANFVARDGVVMLAVRYHVSGLDALSGRELWRYSAPLDTIDDPQPRPGYVVEARIAADDHTVYVPAWGATVSALDAKTGQAKWVWRVEPSLQHRSGASGVAVSGDTVFASIWHFLNQTGTQSEAWVAALDRTTGAELWRVVLPKPAVGTGIDGAPAVWTNLVIVTFGGGDLFAIDRRTHSIAWHVPPALDANGFGTRLITGAKVYGDVVYSNGSDRKLHAYRAADGTELWATEVGQLPQDPAVSDKYVYASNGTTLFILDRLSGRVYRGLGHPRGQANFTFSSAPTVANGRVFVTVNDGAWSFDEP